MVTDCFVLCVVAHLSNNNVRGSSSSYSVRSFSRLGRASNLYNVNPRSFFLETSLRLRKRVFVLVLECNRVCESFSDLLWITVGRYDSILFVFWLPVLLRSGSIGLIVKSRWKRAYAVDLDLCVETRCLSSGRMQRTTISMFEVG